MKRRKVLRLFAFLGVAGLTGGSLLGIRFNLHKSNPGLEYLDSKLELMKSLVDMLIPKSDSPSASESGVHHFVILMVKDCIDIRSQVNFVEGLKSLESLAKNKVGNRFEDCSVSQQREILSGFERKGKPLPGLLGKARNRFLGGSFFSILKTYTSIGYFTSKQGATGALLYLPVPGRYESCVDISRYPKSWATQ